MDLLAKSIEHYLPVFIPVFLTIISVLSGIVTKRIDLTFSSLLKIHSDIVLGLFSFVIWAFVAYQQTGVIQLNPESQLSFIRVVLLLFANIILLIAGQIVLNMPWEGRQGKENAANGTFVAVTLLAVFAPILLAVPLQPKAQARPTNYRVAVVYQDSSLLKLAPGKLTGRRLCEVVTVPAIEREEAVKNALAVFKASDNAVPAYQKDAHSNTVSIDEGRIVAEAAK